MLCSLLLTLTASAQVVETPVDRTASSIPVAVQQRYLSQAIESAVDQLDFSSLKGRTYELEVSGVLQMSDQALGDYVRQTVETRIALAGGRVSGSQGDGRVIIRLSQAGIDRVVEPETVRRPDTGRRLGWTLVGVGAATLVSGLVVGSAETYHYEPDYDYSDDFDSSYSYYTSGWEEGPTPYVLLGLGTTSTIWGLTRLSKPRETTSLVTSYRVRVSIDATIIPDRGEAWSTNGAADIPIAEQYQ